MTDNDVSVLRPALIIVPVLILAPRFSTSVSVPKRPTGSVRSSSVQNCLRTLKRLAREFVNAAVRWSHQQTTADVPVPFATLRPLVQTLVRLGLSLDWMVQLQSKSEAELQAKFVPRLSSTPYEKENCLTDNEFNPALMELLLDETCALRGGGSKEVALKDNGALLQEMVQVCSCNYIRVPSLHDAVMHIAQTGSLHDDNTRQLFKYIEDFPYPWLEGTGTQIHAENAPPAWVTDEAMKTYHERLFCCENDDVRDMEMEAFVSDRQESLASITKLRLGCRLVALPGSRGLYRLQRNSRRQRQQKFAKLAAELVGVCPRSAIHVDVVKNHLLQWRDDVLDPAYLASDKYPMGIFADPASADDAAPWRLPIESSIRRTLPRIPTRKLARLHECLLADAANVQLPVRDRTLAAGAAIALPSCGLADVRPFLEDATRAAENETSTVPQSVSMALLRGVLQCDDRTEPLRYLLSPARIALVEALGVRPMHVVSSAAKLLPPASAVSLMRAFLHDDARTNAIGVGGQKQLVRLLYSIGTPDAHALLLQCWTWPTLTHTDVKIEILHTIASMLDSVHQPVLLVPEDAVWEVRFVRS